MATVRIEDMCWPLPDSDLEYRLRYCQSQITDCEKLRAAAILSAYSQMIKMTRDARQKVISAIRLDQNRRKRWGRIGAGELDGEGGAFRQLEGDPRHDGELEHDELEKIRKCLRELSNRITAFPITGGPGELLERWNIIVAEEERHGELDGDPRDAGELEGHPGWQATIGMRAMSIPPHEK